jgi:hypothetical protein
MHALFETDMALERLELRELNDTAQQILTSEWEAKTQIVEKEKPNLIASFFRGFRGHKKELPDLVELRVSKLETMLRQKAGFKHIALFAFYLISIIGIKLDERYSLLDRFFMPAEAEMVAASEKVRPHVYTQTDIEPIHRTAARDLAALNPPSTDPEGTDESPTAPAVQPPEHSPSTHPAAPPAAARHAAIRKSAPVHHARVAPTPRRKVVRTSHRVTAKVAPRKAVHRRTRPRARIASKSKKSALNRSISSTRNSRTAKRVTKPKHSASLVRD